MSLRSIQNNPGARSRKPSLPENQVDNQANSFQKLDFFKTGKIDLIKKNPILGKIVLT